MPPPNKVVDKIFAEFYNIPEWRFDGKIHKQHIRRFLAESLVEVLAEVYDTPDVYEALGKARNMLSALKEKLDEK